MARKNSQYMYLFFQSKIEHNLNIKIVVRMMNYGLASAVTSLCVNSVQTKLYPTCNQVIAPLARRV